MLFHDPPTWDNRQAKRDIDTAHVSPLFGLRVEMKSLDLHGNMALIVIHRDADVIGAGDGFGKERIRRMRTFDIDAFGPRIGNCWNNLLALFDAKEPAVAGVGV